MPTSPLIYTLEQFSYLLHVLRKDTPWEPVALIVDPPRSGASSRGAGGAGNNAPGNTGTGKQQWQYQWDQ